MSENCDILLAPIAIQRADVVVSGIGICLSSCLLLTEYTEIAS